MFTLTREMLENLQIQHADDWLEALTQTQNRFDISTRMRLVMFLATTLYETRRFTRLKESLVYTPQNLFATFPRHVRSLSDAEALVNDGPAAIANRLYANRMGNGDEASGDGFRFIGRGLFHLTGKSNYKACGYDLELDLVSEPELLEEPMTAALSGGWFWDGRSLNEAADADNWETVVLKVNGAPTVSSPTVRFDQRTALLKECFKVIV